MRRLERCPRGVLLGDASSEDTDAHLVVDLGVVEPSCEPKLLLADGVPLVRVI